LVNVSGVLIHYVVTRARICPVAFILDERAPLMVNRWCAAARKPARRDVPRVNLTLNRIGLEHGK
jgi:hypothetical protein